MADLAQQLEGLAVEIDTDALWAVQENDIAALLRRAKGEITALRTQFAEARVQERERCAQRVERMSNSTLDNAIVPGMVRIQIVMPKEYANGWHAACKRAAAFIRALSPTPNQEKKE